MQQTSRAQKKKAPLTPFRVAHGVVKTIAIVAGLPLTVISLMGLVGLVTDNFWIRLVPALLVALGSPLFLVDRLLPDDDQRKARGLPTDVLALCWMGFSVLFVGVAGPLTGSLLVAEGDRYARADAPAMARLVYWAGGVVPQWPAPRAPEPDGRPEPATPSTETLDGGLDGALTAASASGAAAPDGGANPSDAATSLTADGGLASKTWSPVELLQKVTPAVVTIAARGPTGEMSGTGFFVDQRGTLVTTQEVVRGATAVVVRLSDGSWLNNVELLEESSDLDVALLRVSPPPSVSPLVLRAGLPLPSGEPVICVGNALGLEPTLSNGQLAESATLPPDRWLVVTALVSSGNSGGPVLSLTGEVIGMATAARRLLPEPDQGLNVAVPASRLREMLQEDHSERRRYRSGAEGPTRW